MRDFAICNFTGDEREGKHDEQADDEKDAADDVERFFVESHECANASSVFFGDRVVEAVADGSGDTKIGE